MSVLEGIRGFERTQLKAVDTCVTMESGRKLKEKLGTDGYHAEMTAEFGEGYVHDFDPDLQVVEIREKLCFGSGDVAQSLEVLKEHKITHVLNLCMSYNLFPEHFKYKDLPMFDLPTIDITRYFSEAFKFIDDAILTGGKVFVHCNAGVSRCPSITAAYLMKREKVRLKDILSEMSEQRYVRPNAGFMRSLEKYDEKLFGKT